MQNQNQNGDEEDEESDDEGMLCEYTENIQRIFYFHKLNITVWLLTKNGVFASMQIFQTCKNEVNTILYITVEVVLYFVATTVGEPEIG